MIVAMAVNTLIASGCVRPAAMFIPPSLALLYYLFPDFVLPFPAYVLSFFVLLPLELFCHVPNLVRKTSARASFYDFKRLLIYLD